MKAVPLTEEIYKYVIDKSVSEDELLDELLIETETLEIPMIQISPDQGRFLTLLCMMIKAKQALEIGTLTGYSGIHIARGLRDGGKLITVELMQKHVEIEQKHGDTAKKYFEKAGLRDKAEVMVSPALEQMKKFVSEKRKFDFIFIDADKTTYPDYFEEAVKLSNSGTVIALDNMLKAGKVIEDAGEDADLRAVQITNEIISKDKRVESMILTIGDGLCVAVVK
jgi:predicted O-methyltransferase YrrM